MLQKKEIRGSGGKEKGEEEMRGNPLEKESNSGRDKDVLRKRRDEVNEPVKHSNSRSFSRVAMTGWIWERCIKHQ